ncbi:ribosomal protein S5 domain 2-type protein [Dunaliella salina]|uniref:Ribosomal RNA-processing protein 43 n=1 Tax=Dunaliella salina TaxID=3046 RepID=A0ABQ7FXJ4_DUNSA|nr:ribosomal protein S5 domain 2-type protein [Dunaliella salina]|eukprot:KAF5827076.1 ribosomal protein S5 domain 2-type protein [Dunaliella salina]
MDADSYKKLYPELFLDTFVKNGVRPDGRTLGKGRAVVVGPGAVNASQGSALVRLGHTSVLAGARATLMRPAEGTADEGSLSIEVQFAPFATPQGGGMTGPRGPTAELVSAVSERLQASLRPLGIPKQLCIKPGSGAYAVEADIYVLNADGAVFDAVLLAAMVMLRDLALPPTKEVTAKEGGGSQAAGPGSVRALTEEEAAAAGIPPVRLQLPLQPLAVTCCMYKEHLLVDPTAEEEAVAGSTVSVVLDASAALHGVYKSGGSLAATPMDFTRCVESAKLRYKELAALVEQAFAPDADD